MSAERQAWQRTQRPGQAIKGRALRTLGRMEGSWKLLTAGSLGTEMFMLGMPRSTHL